MTKPIIVIGHRNPDTDSVCSAIAYAYLKKQQGLNAIPARAGKLNPETAFILDYFKVPVPKLVNYFYPVLSDLKLLQAPTVGPEASLRDVGSLFMANQHLKAVPVLKEDDTIAGVITIGDLAKRYYTEHSIQDLENGETSYQSIIKTLEGQLICGDITRTFKGKVKIGASRAETLATTIGAGDLVLMADRELSQRAVLEAGAAGLILTRNTKVSEEILALANSRQAIIIVTPYDTYTTARMINQSIPVRLLMTKEVVCFKTTDLVSEAREKMLRAKFVSYPVLDHGKYVGLMDRSMMLEPERQQVILVDHNERSQAVEGIEETQLLEIIDHHRLGGLTTGAPIYIRQEPVGSTATIVANMTWKLNYAMPPQIAGLLFAAIISDTLFFRSPTSTLVDEETAKRLAVQAGVDDMPGLAMEILRQGSVINTMRPEEIIRNDFKEFDFGDKKLTVSQITIMDREQALSKLPELQKALEAFRAKEKYDEALLMVTDILGEGTDLLHAGDLGNVLALAFGDETEQGFYYLPGVMSRKKQIIPPLTEAFKRLD